MSSRGGPRGGGLVPARMPIADVVRVAGHGLRARPTRILLSALGIAIGIAAMIGVVGISASSTGELDRRLSALGTNLLTVSPAAEDGAHLPDTAIGMIAAIPGVQSVSALGRTTARVYRNDHIAAAQTGGIVVYAARTDLPSVTGTRLAAGSWLTTATARFPAVVLGWRTARKLAVTGTGPESLVWLGGRWFSVTGITAPNPLVGDLDHGAFVGWPVATAELGFDGHPTTVYTRAAENTITTVQPLLGATANPADPGDVRVSRPSDALLAKQAVAQTLSALLLGLGGVALLVGGVGVANTMVVSVLERRSEIGLRRALGATRGLIRIQFLAEASLLSLFGGAGGVVLGVLVTVGYAAYQSWVPVVPVWAMTGGLGATVLIGALAGFYPAVRAARLPPTEALTG